MRVLRDLMANSTPPPDLTQLLLAWNNGDRAALDRLMPVVYDELRRLARRYMRQEDPAHTLQATALVNEAYMRLVDQKRVNWQNRAHFYAIAAQTMRRILVDHARGHARLKRGGDACKVSLDEALAVSSGQAAELLALDEALNELAKVAVSYTHL